MFKTKTVIAIENVTKIMVNNRYCPIRGITNDVDGMISVMTSRNTCVIMTKSYVNNRVAKEPDAN